jgi:hypothetical protein
MKSYLEKNNLHYFNFSPNSEETIETVILNLPLDTPAEDTSNILENLGFNVINSGKMTATRGAPNGKTRGNPFL